MLMFRSMSPDTTRLSPGTILKKGLIVDKIGDFRATLKDPSRSVEERRVALRFIVHLVGDLHQPLHVGDNHDRGGNDTQVRWFDRGSNMHRLWDSDLIESNTRSEDVWLAELAELDTDKNRAAWMEGTVEGWATESLLAARAAYLVSETDGRIKPGQKLSREYYDAHLPVVRRKKNLRALRVECNLELLTMRMLGLGALVDIGRNNPAPVANLGRVTAQDNPLF